MPSVSGVEIAHIWLALTDFPDVHEHGHTDVVYERQRRAISEEGVPHLQHTGQGKLPPKQEADPTAADGNETGSKMLSHNPSHTPYPHMGRCTCIIGTTHT